MLTQIEQLKAESKALDEEWNDWDKRFNKCSLALRKAVSLYLNESGVLKNIPWDKAQHNQLVSKPLSKERLDDIDAIIGPRIGPFHKDFEHGLLIFPSRGKVRVGMEHTTANTLSIRRIDGHTEIQEIIDFFGLNTSALAANTLAKIAKLKDDITELKEELALYENPRG